MDRRRLMECSVLKKKKMFFRFPPELGEASGVHRADPRSGEGSVQSPEDPQRHAQIRPDIPRLSGGTDHRQEQGQGEFRSIGLYRRQVVRK